MVCSIDTYSHSMQVGAAYLFLYRFCTRAISTCTMTARKHFEEVFTDFLKSMYDYAWDRDTNILHIVESYFEARHDNIDACAAYMIKITYAAGGIAVSHSKDE